MIQKCDGFALFFAFLAFLAVKLRWDVLNDADGHKKPGRVSPPRLMVVVDGLVVQV